MTNSHDIVITGTGGSTPPATVKVWDLFVRVFHWSLVLLFAIAYLTDDEVQRVHIVTGYAIAGLLGARIVWGFIGPRHARFDDFVHSPRAVFAYVRDALLLRARRYVGHNPAGGLMIVALLVMLTATCISGHMMTTDSVLGLESDGRNSRRVGQCDCRIDHAAHLRRACLQLRASRKPREIDGQRSQAFTIRKSCCSQTVGARWAC